MKGNRKGLMIGMKEEIDTVEGTIMTEKIETSTKKLSMKEKGRVALSTESLQGLRK